MAASGEEEMAESWWGGWFQAAKDTGIAALDMVRKDLAEFGCTMQSDAGQVVELTSSTLKDSLKTENTSAAKDKLTRGLHAVLDTISQALVVPPDDDDQIPITASSAELYDRAKARLHAVQIDPGTYLNEPSGPNETYCMWCEGFDLEDKKSQISDLLVTKAEVRGLYTKLVPARVSHVEFWRRYFYKLHQMDVDQARKEALMKRAEASKSDDSVGWEDDWSGDEAAEDSGSDWEKLPKPSQQRSSSSATTSSSSRSTAAAPEQRKDPETVVTCSEGSSGVDHEAEVDRIGRSQEVDSEAVQQSPRSEVPVQKEELAPSVVTSSPEDQATEMAVSSSVKDRADSPSQQRSTETFKDYLRFAGSEMGVEFTETDCPAHSLPQETQVGSSGETSVDLEATPPPTVSSTVAEACPTASKISESPPADASSDLQPETSPEPAMPISSPATSQPSHEAAAAVAQEAAKEELSVSVSEEPYLKTTERGDLVVVGSDHGSPVSNTSGSKGMSDVDEEWEKDLDIELTEEDMALTEEDMKDVEEEVAKRLAENLDLEEDEWESWE